MGACVDAKAECFIRVFVRNLVVVALGGLCIWSVRRCLRMTGKGRSENERVGRVYVQGNPVVDERVQNGVEDVIEEELRCLLADSKVQYLVSDTSIAICTISFPRAKEEYYAFQKCWTHPIPIWTIQNCKKIFVDAG